MSSRWRKFAAQTATFDHALHKIGPLNHDCEHYKTLDRQVRALHAVKVVWDSNPQKARAHFSCGPTSLINYNKKRMLFGLLASGLCPFFGTYGVSLGFSLVETRPLAVPALFHDPSPTYLTECVNNVLRICRSGTNTFGRRAAPPIDKHVYAKVIPTCFVFSSAILSVLHNCCHRILLAGCVFF